MTGFLLTNTEHTTFVSTQETSTMAENFSEYQIYAIMTVDEPSNIAFTSRQKAETYINDSEFYFIVDTKLRTTEPISTKKVYFIMTVDEPACVAYTSQQEAEKYIGDYTDFYFIVEMMLIHE